MIAVKPNKIEKIDEYAESIGISVSCLMTRAGEAVAKAADTLMQGKSGKRVLILCGGGNNGGDGYAAAILLCRMGYEVTTLDFFGKGQRTEAGRAMLDACLADSAIRVQTPPYDLKDELSHADLVIEGIFGTGARGTLPASVIALLDLLAEEKKARGSTLTLISIDTPIALDAEHGTACGEAIAFDATVMLAYPKIGLYAYPAARYVGTVFYSDLGLPKRKIDEALGLGRLRVIDEGDARAWLPPRSREGHKGSFGTLTAAVGSNSYPGAAALACEGAHRMGVGLLRLFCTPSVASLVLSRTPETVCEKYASLDSWSDAQIDAFCKAPRTTAYLVGSGCGAGAGLARLLKRLLESEGAPLVLDADALNVLARDHALLACVKRARRAIAMTPHPLELARLAGVSPEAVNEERLRVSADFAAEYGVTLLLKGAGTVIATEGGEEYVLPFATSALAKGGSGDVLAGMIASLAAQGVSLPHAAAIAAYLHARAAESLENLYTARGVLPHDLPLEAAKILAAITAEG